MKPQYRKFFIYSIPHSPIIIIIIIINFLRGSREGAKGEGVEES